MVSVVLMALIFMCNITYAVKQLDESTAKSFLKSKLQHDYHLIPEGQVQFVVSGGGFNYLTGIFFNPKDWKPFTKTLDYWKEKGLIDYNITSSSNITETPSGAKIKKKGLKSLKKNKEGAEIAVREEAKNYPHVFLYNKYNVPVRYENSTDPSVYAFISGERKIDKIVALEKKDDNYVVKFLFSLIPNEFGKRLNQANPQKTYTYKGISEIKYDVFTDKYILKSVKYSDLEGPTGEYWNDLPWSEEVAGKTVARWGDQ